MFQKLILTLVLGISLAAGTATLSSAQDTAKPYTLSIFGGAGFGNLEGSFDIPNVPATHQYFTEMAYNWTVGVKLNYALNGLFYLNGGIAYKSVAGQYRLEEKANMNNYDANLFCLNYLNIPIVVRMGKGFFVGAGAYMAVQLGSGKVEAVKTGTSIDLPDNWNHKLDYGLIAELGFVIKTPVELGLRLEYGFVNVVDKPQDGTYGIKMKNINLTLILGVELDLFN